MSTLQMKPGQVEEAGKTIQRFNDEMYLTARDLGGQANALRGAWQGESAEMFIEDLYAVVGELYRLAETGFDIGTRMIREITDWLAADRAFGDQHAPLAYSPRSGYSRQGSITIYENYSTSSSTIINPAGETIQRSGSITIPPEPYPAHTGSITVPPSAPPEEPVPRPPRVNGPAIQPSLPRSPQQEEIAPALPRLRPNIAAALPSSGIPSNIAEALPSSARSGTGVRAVGALPASARPAASALPASALPASALPASALPSN